MPADAGIFAQIQPVRPRNMLADFADIAQIQGLQQRQQLGALQMDALRQQTQDRNALNSLWAGAVGPDGKIDRNRVIAGAAQGGLGAHVPGLQKSFADADKADAEAKGKLLENTKRRVELSGQAFGFVRSAPTLENANSALNFLEQNGIFDGPTAAKYREQITANPASIPALAEQAFRAALDAKEQLAKIETRDTGGAVQTLATDPVTMQQRTLGTVQKTQSPDNKASVAASLENARATRDAAKITADGNRDAARIKDIRDTEMKLADDYRAQSKNFKEVVDAAGRVKAALPSATKSAASTLAAATSFMKMLDPGSVVRESELGMALAATGAFDRLANYHNVLRHGKVLTPEQAADFNDITDKILEAAKTGQRTVDEFYRGQAKQFGLKPEMIVQDLGQNASQPVDLRAMPSGGARATGGGKVVDFGSLK